MRTNKEVSTISVSNIPSIGMDLKLDSLKSLLDSLSGCINQHAVLLDNLNKKIDTKQNQDSIPNIVNQLSEGILIFDQELMQAVQSLIGKHQKKESNQQTLETMQNKFINRSLLHSFAFSHLFQKIKNIETQIIPFQQEINSKLDIQIWKKTKKKHKTLFKDLNKQTKETTENKIREIDKRISDQIKNTQNSLQDVERKTIWRVSELEQQIKKKISENYFTEQLKSIEQLIKKQDQPQTKQSDDLNLKMFQELRVELKCIEEIQNDKIKSLKGDLINFSESNDKIFLLKSHFEDFRKITNDKILEIVAKIKEVEKKADYTTQFNILNTNVNLIKNNFTDFQGQMERKFQTIIETQAEFKIEQESINKHKICHVENLISTLQREIQLFKNEIRTVANEKDDNIFVIKKELQQLIKNETINNSPLLIQKFTTEISQSIINSQNEFDKKFQQIQTYIAEENKKNSEEEKYKKLVQLVTDINKRQETVETRFQRILKDIDITNLLKQIKSKADDDKVQRQQAVSEAKSNQFDETIKILKRDIENLAKLYETLFDSLRDGTFQALEQEMVLTAKRLLPVSCISCKNSNINAISQQNQFAKASQKNLGQVFGKDNKLYKCDMNRLFKSGSVSSNLQVVRPQSAVKQS